MKTYLLQKLTVIVGFLQQVTKNASNPVMWLIAVGGSAFSNLIGGYDLMVKVLVLLIAADYITGIVASAMEGKLSSKVGFKGIGKKMFILLLVVVGHQADIILGINIIRNAIIFFYVANEIISLIENADRFGLPVPPILNLVVELLQKKANPTLPESKDND